MAVAPTILAAANQEMEDAMKDEPLPPRRAMHRDTPAGSRIEIANAYAIGRLVEVGWLRRFWRRLR